MNIVYLSLGSNIGNRLKYLNDALELIEEKIGKIQNISSIYETEPWGKTDQPNFLNMTACIHSMLLPEVVLKSILEIEQLLGRIRIEKWRERIIDIDILFYNDEIINLPELIVPHPNMQDRQFVLVPLNEIAPSFYHPVLQCTINELLLKCSDTTGIINIYEPSV
jgi:2-amino-4-hydroxy-6-hydroxymethyldihydropteridine diphosphokinase